MNQQQTDPQPTSPAPATQRVRKNIDDLSPQELDDYLHAVTTLVNKSNTDPNDFYGYLYYELLHDSLAVGPCEHGSEAFLPWHRMALWLYENALRMSDPPRTSNVTLPYWDWTQLPSGSRYPKAFEDTSSVLYTLPLIDPNTGTIQAPPGPKRAQKPICRAGQNPQTDNCARLPFPYYPAMRSPNPSSGKGALDWPNWSTDSQPTEASFGGGRLPDDPGFGALEQPAHNTMHTGYVAGYLFNADTAGQDPIFWTFHAFIDLLFAQWQQMSGHEVDTCPDCVLTWNTMLPGYPPYTLGQVSQKIVDGFIPMPDPGPDKGYSYEYTPPPPPATPEGALEAASPELLPTHPAKDFAASGKKEPDTVHAMDITIPKQSVSAGQVRLKGVTVGTPFAYSGDVYLSPQDVEFNPRDFDFREKYFVNLITIWMGHEGHGHHGNNGEHEGHEGHEGHDGHGAGNAAHGMHDIDLLVDLTPQLNSLAASHAGETWKLNVALVTLEDEQQPRAGLEASVGGATNADIVKLQDMQLELS